MIGREKERQKMRLVPASADAVVEESGREWWRVGVQ
jgi:hypothetical protein